MTSKDGNTMTVRRAMSGDNTVLGGTVSGLHRHDVPREVETLLRWHPQSIELRIRPEAPHVDDDHHYAIDWQFLDLPDTSGHSHR